MQEQPIQYHSSHLSQSPQKIPAAIKFSFTITYILLLTTATITFIEAIRTKNPTVRHVLNLETCISVVAGYFYSIFTIKIADIEKTNTQINWAELMETRYIDWIITTPLMLIALCVVLSTELGLDVRLPIIAIIIVLNYAMLYAGYLGETNRIDKVAGIILGFLSFFAMFGIIYWKYVAPKFHLANRVLFYFYLFVWSLYGVVYFLDEETRNIAMNILDLFAKCLIGLGLWVYYVHIIRL
jgi:bacteriorhodopsin